MCSSTDRNTSQEVRILDSFQSAYAHLYHIQRRAEAESTIQHFIVLLDCDKFYLFETIRKELKWWHEMKNFVLKKRDSDNIWRAGNSLAEVGACLFEFGRAGEAMVMCEAAARLHALALRVQELENEEDAREQEDSARAKREQEELDSDVMCISSNDYYTKRSVYPY